MDVRGSFSVSVLYSSLVSPKIATKGIPHQSAACIEFQTFITTGKSDT